MKELVIIMLLFVASPSIFASPGDLDTTWGSNGGFVVSNLFAGNILEEANDVAVQTDGKIVVVGRRHESVNTFDYLVVRYNVDGTLDNTFSGDGIFLLNNSSLDVLNAVVIQSDGKIVAVGQTNLITEAFVIRLNTDGTLDTTFSGDGILKVSGTGFALSVAIQSDSKIVCGSRSLSGESIVFRLNSVGTLDATFDGDGIVSLSPNQYEPYGIAIQANDRIVVAGTSSLLAGADFVTVRLLSSGALDTNFDGDGIAVTAVYAGVNAARCVIVQTDGKIAVGGGGSPDAAIVRYNSNGSLDTTFDMDGIRIFNVNNNGNDYFNDIAQQTDGKLLAIADTTYSLITLFVPEDYSVLRLNSDGSLDSTFDGNGIVRSQWCEDGQDLYIQTDGKIVTTGRQVRSPAVNDSGVCTQRFDAEGSVDTSLNFVAGNGTLKQTVLSSQEFTSIEAIESLPNGKILVAGWGQVPNQIYNTSKLIRLNPDGTLDTSFMDEGIYEFTNSTTSTYFNDLKILSDGSFFVAGEAGIPSGGIVAKFTPAGTLDTSFSGDGIFTSGSAISRVYALAVQTDGKIIGCGSNGSGLSTRNSKIVRLSATGTLELDSFVFLNNANSHEIFECGLQSDGKLVVAGYANNGTSDYIALSRVLSNFAMDTTFGSGGVVATDMSAALNDRATDMVIQPDNKIVVSAMGSNVGGDRDFAVLRYEANGVLDTNFTENFGASGISLIDFVLDDPNDEANALLLQPDGQMIVGGSSNPGTGNRFGLAKLEPGGALVFGWGTLGRTVTPFPNNDARINALAFHQGTGILAAGRTWNGTDYDFAIARYQNEFIPTAAHTSVSGRVVTANGNGIRNVWVSLSDPERPVRRSLTGPFGYYRFDDIEAGRTYSISVASKSFQFANGTQIVSVNDEIYDLDFIALP